MTKLWDDMWREIETKASETFLYQNHLRNMNSVTQEDKAGCSRMLQAGKNVSTATESQGESRVKSTEEGREVTSKDTIKHWWYLA